jgi:hypothetical protein
VNTVPKNVGKFLSSGMTGDFSKRIQPVEFVTENAIRIKFFLFSRRLLITGKAFMLRMITLSYQHAKVSVRAIPLIKGQITLSL